MQARPGYIEDSMAGSYASQIPVASVVLVSENGMGSVGMHADIGQWRMVLADQCWIKREYVG